MKKITLLLSLTLVFAFITCSKQTTTPKVTYTVTFDTNGGSAITSIPVSSGSTITAPATPTKAGCTFVEWDTDMALTKKFDLTTKITANTTLYAKWNVTYTVTFITNGGSLITSIPVGSGSTITAPTAPTKAGCTFVEWDTDVALTKKFDFATTITANTTLYAKWSVITYTVTFVPNGGNTIDPIPVNSGSAITAPATPTKAGCTFVEWDTDAALTKKFDFTTTKITANTTLYAKWSVITYTVMFDTKGGNAINTITVNSGSAITVPTLPTKANCTFVGWYSDFNLLTPFILSTPITANITLYAKWVVNPMVTFITNGGNTIDPQSVSPGTATSAPTPPTRAGYTFENWYSDQALTTVFSFSTPITANITLYAQWTFIPVVTTIGTAAQFGNFRGIAVDKNDIVYVADGDNNSIRKVTPADAVTTLAGGSSFNNPTGVTVDANGNVYVANTNSILKITSAGAVTTLVSSSAGIYPFSIALDASGTTLYIGEVTGQSVRKVTSTGTVSAFASNLGSPFGVAVDGSGNVYVANSDNNSIYKITPAGSVTTLAGGGAGSGDGTGASAHFSAPRGVAVDADGNVYVADQNNNSIRKVTPAGVVTTLAGGTYGTADGAGRSAQFSTPASIAIDKTGKVLYVGDYSSGRIRKVQIKP